MSSTTFDNHGSDIRRHNGHLEMILALVTELRDEIHSVKAEIKVLKKGIAEIKDEIKGLKRIIEEKIDNAFKLIEKLLKGYGIVDCEEEYLTETQVCERYGVCRRTMYNYRKDGLIPFIRLNDGVNSKILYRKADVIEFFAERNATLTPKQ